MTRKFVNNFSTTLSGNITDVQTTIPLQSGDGALLPDINQPSGFDPYSEDLLLTIDDGVNIEIVRVIDHDGSDTIDEVERGAEGTTALAFTTGDTVECRVTMGALEELYQNVQARGEGTVTAQGAFSVEIIPRRFDDAEAAAAANSVVIGPFAGVTVEKQYGIAIGDSARDINTTVTSPSIIIGHLANDLDSEDAIVIGQNATLSSSGTFVNRSIMIGNDGQIRNDDSVLIGYSIGGNGENTVFIGADHGSASFDSTNAVGIGNAWNNSKANDNTDDFGSLVIGHAKDGLDEALPGLARVVWPRGYGPRIELLDSGDGLGQLPSYANNGTEVTLATMLFDNTATNPWTDTGGAGPEFTWYLGVDNYMFVEQVEVIFDTNSGTPTVVNTDMVIDVGSTGIDSTDILSAQTVSSAVVPANQSREVFTSATPDQAYNAITVTLDTPANYDSGNFNCYVVIRGTLFHGL